MYLSLLCKFAIPPIKKWDLSPSPSDFEFGLACFDQQNAGEMIYVTFKVKP